MRSETYEIYPGYDPYAIGDQLFTVAKDGKLLVDAWDECRLIDVHTEAATATFVFQKRYPGNGSLDAGSVIRFQFSGLDAAKLADLQEDSYVAALSLQHKNGNIVSAVLPGTADPSPVTFQKAVLQLKEPQWQEQAFAAFSDEEKNDAFMTQLTHEGRNLFDLRSDTTVVHTLYDSEKALCIVICELGDSQEMYPEGTLIKLQFSDARVTKLSIEGEDVDDLGHFDDIAVTAKDQYRIRYGSSIAIDITSTGPRLFIQKQ